MISVEEALDKILEFVDVLDGEDKPLLDCFGQVLDEDVYAPFDVPPRDNSAMDGYAVQSASIQGASEHQPKFLRIIGEVAAGSVPGMVVRMGTAVRIMTGAPLPQGADVVVPFEATDEGERKESSLSKSDIGIQCSLPKEANIRRSGEDIAKGDLVMRRGSILIPAALGVIASLGKTSARVIRRPLVGILATGDEVVAINQPLPPGKIYNSNSYSLAAQVLCHGGMPRLLGISTDNFGQLSMALQRGLECDVLITSGGVSMGDYDMVKQVLAAEGDISFWTVRMKPGKPLAFGTFTRGDGKKIPHLGLPGNPVSSMVTFEVFARPAIHKMMGKDYSENTKMRAVMEDSVKNSDGRRVFARVVISKRGSEYFAKLAGSQGSGILTSMMRANGLAIIPETVSMVRPGDTVEVIMFDWEQPPVMKLKEN
jgi:molybdopterin molybdotransferase